MSLEDFTLMLTYLMELCWAAAAGQLELVVSKGREEEGLHVCVGICSKTDYISHKVLLLLLILLTSLLLFIDKFVICEIILFIKDIIISCESLELFVTCLKLRKNDLLIFYKLPKVEEFIIDLLLGSASSLLRMTMVDYLHELCEDISVFSGNNITK